MVYLSFKFIVFTLLLIVIYYAMPIRARWFVLMLGSAFFYYHIATAGRKILILMIVSSYFFAILIGKKTNRKKDCRYFSFQKLTLLLAIFLCVLPLLLTKYNSIFQNTFVFRKVEHLSPPIGISFITLQVISYLVDVYRGTVKPQKNFFKYFLFISFFPQVIQGPIPRYSQLEHQLFDGNKFSESSFCKGFVLVMWGFFLKYMIADKASIFVDTVFSSYYKYSGIYIFVAGILYSVQLYTDFLACTNISRGVANFFGIELINNFNHPYFAQSVKDFWKRWHISLSTWLRDYIYIPLGGNRRGKFFKYCFIVITFTVSGVWHGVGKRFLAWGVMHAGLQIIYDLIFPLRKKMYAKLSINEKSSSYRIFRAILTFFLVMNTWIIFRANSLTAGCKMLFSMYVTFNPWILFNDGLFYLGLDWREFLILFFSISILFVVSIMQTKIDIRSWFFKKNVVFRYFVYLATICIILLFGSYGYGFEPKDFIYGSF